MLFCWLVRLFSFTSQNFPFRTGFPCDRIIGGAHFPHRMESQTELNNVWWPFAISICSFFIESRRSWFNKRIVIDEKSCFRNGIRFKHKLLCFAVVVFFSLVCSVIFRCARCQTCDLNIVCSSCEGLMNLELRVVRWLIN